MQRWRRTVGELAAAQKAARGVSLWSRYVNRPLGRRLAATAIVLGLSADAVTVLSALVTAAGLALVALVPPALWSGLLAAALLVLGFALDSADGQVARYTGTGSAAGEWFDHVVDAAKMVAVHTCVLIGWYRFGDLPGDAWLLLPLAYQLVAVVVFAGGTLASLLRRSPAPPAAPSTARAVALLPADFGVLALTFVTWGAPEVFRSLYALLAVATTVIGAALVVRWYTGLRTPQAVLS
ncbi:CDP-alcohol phosphatidyltransferase family protein [Cellulomonas sp. zg-ZUI222]|uniref:CDP-alcohol phosphatidyltransferase family protein n=1 Tax=Cellulomonas wangleii TaxID=2816956 RepID=A0ABX8D6X3_9CELL|nr:MULTISPECIES: CDP-alcohol phosphatidyltransferase family protein [Cellulomonas]MBO0901081.1 CDP-alcohol phosphatidyltransferase family protein [Cellulomonas sp. zg-ZUI22]MBO0922606.1 CDP-alcohol phosphatidyltransferase family protein [Cellulomonas wangleii]MBO0926688.1 CDP-alcohol phosphatidyltransferase family protein [Cellulomonas wangleii]QVI63193.1 CDP-alcohol phosphatidyltransferase family protein [Cellulomonas wangleii]